MCVYIHSIKILLQASKQQVLLQQKTVDGLQLLFWMKNILKYSFRYFNSKKRVSYCWTEMYIDSAFPWVLKWKGRLKASNIYFENIFEILLLEPEIL